MVLWSWGANKVPFQTNNSNENTEVNGIKSSKNTGICSMYSRCSNVEDYYCLFCFLFVCSRFSLEAQFNMFWSSFQPVLLSWYYHCCQGSWKLTLGTEWRFWYRGKHTKFFYYQISFANCIIFTILVLCNNITYLIVLQLEVGGSVTTRELDNLISQTEYSLTVTPVYDEGRGQTMQGSAITGKEIIIKITSGSAFLLLYKIEITTNCPPSCV